MAGFAGTLADRFRTAPAAAAAGEVRAKTGTLEGVSALAGLVRTAGGRLLVFDLTATSVPSRAARTQPRRHWTAWRPRWRPAAAADLRTGGRRPDRGAGPARRTYRAGMPSPVDYGLAAATARRRHRPVQG